jgi:GTPase SAR1 family protein
MGDDNPELHKRMSDFAVQFESMPLLWSSDWMDPPDLSSLTPSEMDQAVYGEVPEARKARFLVTGDMGVGKQTLMKSLCSSSLPEWVHDHERFECFGIQHLIKNVIVEGQLTQVQYWIDSGHKSGASTVQELFHLVDSIIIMFNVCAKETLTTALAWIDRIRKWSLTRHFVFLVGNQVDRIEQRQFTLAEGRDLARKLRVAYLEMSAMTGFNARSGFSLAMDLILAKKSNLPFSEDLVLQLNHCGFTEDLSIWKGDYVEIGFMDKQGQWNGKYRRRWFVLRDRALYYYIDPTSKEPKGKVDLTGAELLASNDGLFEICADNIRWRSLVCRQVCNQTQGSNMEVSSRKL